MYVQQRASVTSEGNIEERGLIPLDRAFDSSVRLVRSQATEVNSSHVTIETGEAIPYEHLVFATGSIWTGALALPDSRTAAIEHLRLFRKNLNAAQHVLIAGGGPVGVGQLLCAHFDRFKRTDIYLLRVRWRDSSLRSPQEGHHCPPRQ